MLVEPGEVEPIAAVVSPCAVTDPSVTEPRHSAMTAVDFSMWLFIKYLLKLPIIRHRDFAELYADCPCVITQLACINLHGVFD